MFNLPYTVSIFVSFDQVSCACILETRSVSVAMGPKPGRPRERCPDFDIPHCVSVRVFDQMLVGFWLSHPSQTPSSHADPGSPSRFRKQPPRHNPVSVRRGRQTDPLDKFTTSGDSTNMSSVTGVCVNATLESAVPLGCRTPDQLRAVPSFPLEPSSP